MRRFAEKTRVPVGQTQSEIKEVLRRFGAIEIGIVEGATRVLIAFRTARALVNMELDLPDPKIVRDEDRRAQETRRLYRALLLVLKAKLEAVGSGITTLEAEFMSNVVMPDGKTVGYHMLPRLEQIVKDGKLPPLLTAG